MSKIWCVVRGSQKAITAGVVSLVSYAALHAGTSLSPEASTYITGILALVFVYLVPNSKCESA